MTIITDMLTGTCTYWPPGSENSGGVDYDDYGRPSFGTAVEISCRWEDKSVEYLDAQGTVQISRAIVYVDADVRPGGVLWNGDLADVSDLTTPKNNDGAFEVRRFDKTPDFDGAEYVRKAYL